MDHPPLPRGYVCVRATSPVTVTGRGDSAAWESASWSELFVDIEGPSVPAPTFETRFRMLWDDDYWYLHAELEEPNVWATLTEHDSVIFHDNDFELFVDPDGDNHDYFEWEVNAFGTTWDLRLPTPYRDGGPALNEWEIPGAIVAVHVDGTINDPSEADRGWCVEAAFPWSAFAEHAGCRCPPSAGDQWRVNFSRVEWDTRVEGGRTVKLPDRPEHNWVWSPQFAIDMHRPELWGYVQFEDDPRPFRPDPAHEARMQLMALYWAQRAYRERSGRYAPSIAELGLDTVGLTLRASADTWDADLGGLRIDSRSRITRG